MDPRHSAGPDVAAPRQRGQRAFIDDDVTDDLLGQCRVVESKQRLPVQHGSVTLVDVLAASRAGRSRSTKRARLAQTQHQKAPSVSAALQSPSATEVRSNYLTLPRAGITTTKRPAD